MAVPLVVILGAGASRGSVDGTSRPPLTVDLFDERRYSYTLQKYDLAHQAGRYITAERADDDALALEAALHGLRTSEYEHHRHMALAVPLYLQDLLRGISGAYRVAFRYDRLIERLLRLPYVFFVTLNYDMLLDRRLNSHRPLRSVDDYIGSDKNWSLIKLHGSVNWWHPTDKPYSAYTPPPDVVWDGDQFGIGSPNDSLRDLRGRFSTSGIERYPALALPEGRDDRLVLPPLHLEFLASRLQSAHEIDLLVIGYSGLDLEVIRLLSRCAVKVRRMTVVNQDLLSAREVTGRFAEAGIQGVWPVAVDGDFAAWADRGGLNQLVAEYGGPYSSSDPPRSAKSYRHWPAP